MRIGRTVSGFLFVGCLVSSVAANSFGQEGGERPRGGGAGGPGGGRMGGMMGGMMGGGGMSSLLRMKEVREELKIDEEQGKELDAFGKEMRDQMQAQMPSRDGERPDPSKMQEMMAKMRESMAAFQKKTEAKLEDLLDPVQMERLMGLMVQRDGTRALSSTVIATRIGVSDAQKASIAEVEKAAADEMQSMFGGGPPSSDFREKMEKIGKDSESKKLAILTDKQKADMEALKGAKFEFPAPQWGVMGGPGGGRGRDRGN